MNPSLALISLYLALLTFVPSDLPAQTPVILSDVDCATCRIVLRRVSAVEPAPQGGIFTPFSEVMRDDRTGNLFVANEEQAGEIEVYDGSGRYARTIGRLGEGPGEYKRVKDIFQYSGDTIAVFDAGLGRVTYLDRGLVARRTSRFPFTYREMAHVSDSNVVINGVVPTPESIGLPLHLITLEGHLVKSFGADTALYRPDYTEIHIRPVTAGSNGIWAGYIGQYVLDFYNLDGRRTSRIIRDADWFESWTVAQPYTPDEEPQSQIIRIQRDRRGYLWVLVLTPSPFWRDALHRTTGTHGSGYRITRWDRFFGTVIEVIDPRSGKLLASLVSENLFFAFASREHVVSYREGDDALPRLDVWHITLER